MINKDRTNAKKNMEVFFLNHLNPILYCDRSFPHILFFYPFFTPGFRCMLPSWLPFPHSSTPPPPRAIPPHSRPHRPVPAVLFQLLIIMQVPDWLTSSAAGLMGRSKCFQLGRGRQTSFKSKRLQSNHPPMHL